MVKYKFYDIGPNKMCITRNMMGYHNGVIKRMLLYCQLCKAYVYQTTSVK